jgi:pilus assembly protein Flp/PilA
MLPKYRSLKSWCVNFRPLDLLRDRKGQGMVEYALLIAGVALVSIVGVSLFGERTADMIAAVATVLPGADPGDSGPIAVGHLIETTNSSGGPIQLDMNAISSSAGTPRLGVNLTGNSGNGFDGLVVDPITGAGISK